jgi:hypothetical protein
MQQIVLTLLNKGNDVLDPMAGSPWAELIATKFGLEAFKTNWSNGTVNEFTDRRVIKTHAPAHLAPWKSPATEGAKIIVVSRNPADTAVSMWNHSRDIPAFMYGGPFSHFLSELFVKGKVESGCFWDWHRGWRREWSKGAGNILWVTFEEFKENPRDVIIKVCEFIGVECVGDVIDKTVEGTSFNKMKKNFQSLDKKKLEKGLPVKKNHIRKGEKGAWRKKMLETDIETIMNKHNEENRGGEFDFFDFS